VDVVEVEEPCAHEVQFGGMCAECGKDMTEYVYASDLKVQTNDPVVIAILTEPLVSIG
jgi:RNA polymerase II subunit A-like phosphatase